MEAGNYSDRADLLGMIQSLEVADSTDFFLDPKRLIFGSVPEMIRLTLLVCLRITKAASTITKLDSASFDDPQGSGVMS